MADFQSILGTARQVRARQGMACSGKAGQGRVDGRTPGFDSLATHPRGPVGHGWAGVGLAWLSTAGLGVGSWQPSGFEAPTPAPQGAAGRRMAWLRLAWLGSVWQGSAWPAQEGRGSARHGKARYCAEGGWQAPRFEPSAPALTGQGSARSGVARSGKAMQGQAWRGWADGRSAGSTPAPSPLQGRARRGALWLGWVRRAWVGRGVAMQGGARFGVVPATEDDHGPSPCSSPASGRDMVRPGAARHGEAMQGKAWRGLVLVTVLACEVSSQASPATRQDDAWLGEAGRFEEMHGAPRHGKARRVHAGHRKAWWGREPVTAVGRELVSRPSAAPGQRHPRLGADRSGWQWHGLARCARAWCRRAWVPVTAWGWGLAPQPWTAPGWYMARRPEVGHGLAMLAEAGVHQRAFGPSPEFDSPALTSQGAAGHGTARHAEAGRGTARQGFTTSHLEFRMFEVKGDQAEWRLVYSKVLVLDVDDVIKYTDLDEILDRDFLANRSPIYRVISELEKTNARTLATVRGVGYRVAAASEHEGLARAHHQRSRRQMKKAVNKAASADRTALTLDERKRIDGLEMSLRQHSQMIRRLEQRDEQREAQIKALKRDTSADVAELSERVDRLSELLERHGVKPTSPPEIPSP